jgi:hypothetical protein
MSRRKAKKLFRGEKIFFCLGKKFLKGENLFLLERKT